MCYTLKTFVLIMKKIVNIMTALTPFLSQKLQHFDVKFELCEYCAPSSTMNESN